LIWIKKVRLAGLDNGFSTSSFSAHSLLAACIAIGTNEEDQADGLQRCGSIKTLAQQAVAD
jgi:hypothetical protein